jgi:putative FmdB family regulatory protein
MPTYSYRCTACDHAFDIVQAFSDDSLSTCPECGKALRKVFNAIGVTFQGSGFYRTDSRTEAKKNTESKKNTSKPAAEKSTSQSTPSTTTSSAT